MLICSQKMHFLSKRGRDSHVNVLLLQRGRRGRGLKLTCSKKLALIYTHMRLLKTIDITLKETLEEIKWEW